MGITPSDRPSSGKSGDLVLVVGQFALVQDENGNIHTMVGPGRTTVSTSEKVVLWDPKAGEFGEFREARDLDGGKQATVRADEYQYVVLTNPAVDAEHAHPRQTGQRLTQPALAIGTTIIIHGPFNEALWPRQSGQVFNGDWLDPDEFMILRIDNLEATKHWNEKFGLPPWEFVPMLVDVDTGAEIEVEASDEPEADNATETDSQTNGDGSQVRFELKHVPDREVHVGELVIVRGDYWRFFMPCTGTSIVEIDGQTRFNAQSLEELQYCLLRDSAGRVRTVIATDVEGAVFPAKPDEKFVNIGGTSVFPAIEIPPMASIFVKATRPCTDRSGRFWEDGELGQITGTAMPYFYPHPFLKVIRYGDRRFVTFAAAIDRGQGYYAVHRVTGEVRIIEGPAMVLLDPAEEVFVARQFTNEEAELYFPGGGWQYNQAVQRKIAQGDYPTPESAVEEEVRSAAIGAEELAALSILRSTEFTPPRTIDLTPQISTVPRIEVWDDYAVQVTGPDGPVEVISGPAVRLLEYSERLRILELSSGTPKDHRSRIKIVYLQVFDNRVSDIVTGTTRDGMTVKIELQYVVNFLETHGDEDVNYKLRWFRVTNYVQLLTETMRAALREMLLGVDLFDFRANRLSYIYDVVLGPEGDNGKRPGAFYSQNGMHVAAVEVIRTDPTEPTIAELIAADQYRAFSSRLSLQARQRDQATTEMLEQVTRAIAAMKDETAAAQHRLALAELERKEELRQAQDEAELATIEATEQVQAALQQVQDIIQAAQLARELSAARQRQGIEAVDQTAAIELLKAETKAAVERLKTLGDDQIATLERIINQATVSELAKHMGALSVTRGSIVAMLADAFQGTEFGEQIARMFGADSLDNLVADNPEL